MAVIDTILSEQISNPEKYFLNQLVGCNDKVSFEATLVAHLGDLEAQEYYRRSEGLQNECSVLTLTQQKWLIDWHKAWPRRANEETDAHVFLTWLALENDLERFKDRLTARYVGKSVYESINEIDYLLNLSERADGVSILSDAQTSWLNQVRENINRTRTNANGGTKESGTQAETSTPKEPDYNGILSMFSNKRPGEKFVENLKKEMARDNSNGESLGYLVAKTHERHETNNIEREYRSWKSFWGEVRRCLNIPLSQYDYRREFLLKLKKS